METQREDDETVCPYRRACLVIACIVVLLLILWYFGYFTIVRPETLTNDAITKALIAKVLSEDPQNSTAIMRNMSESERAKFEYATALPYDPNYYRPAAPPAAY